MYPLTIVADRYNGVYSGGRYTAWSSEPWGVPEEIFGDDIECFDFFRYNNDLLYGIGQTAEEAEKDLSDKISRKYNAE